MGASWEMPAKTGMMFIIVIIIIIIVVVIITVFRTHVAWFEGLRWCEEHIMNDDNDDDDYDDDSHDLFPQQKKDRDVDGDCRHDVDCFI